MLTPVSSTGYSTEAGTSYSSDPHGTMSPRSISGSTTSTAYATNVPARVVSPRSQKSMGLQVGPPDLRVAASHNPHDSPSRWQGPQHHMQSAQQYQQLPSGRGSWDMSSYLESSPATPVGTSTPQNVNYQSAPSRSVTETALSGDDDRSSRPLPRQQTPQQQSQQVPRS